MAGFMSLVLGVTLEQAEQYEAGCAMFDKALALVTKTAPYHSDIALMLDGQGRCARRAGRLDDARALHERSLAILEKAFGKDSPEVAAPLLELGETSLARADPAGAR